MRLKLMGMVLALGLFMATSAQAQQVPATVTARSPEGIASVMRFAGYPVKLGKDNAGDPMIETEFGGYRGAIYFYGCDKKTHDGCDSLQFSASFDSDKPMTSTAANALAKKWRFASIHLDDEGDPWAQFDVVTLDGIPAPVFLRSMESFSWTLDEIASAVFGDD